VPADVEFLDRIAEISLFQGLPRALIESVAHTFDEMSFEPGERVLRQGLTGSGFYVIVEGEANVVHDGVAIARLMRGDFFGEVSALLDESPTADVVASTQLRCLVLGPTDLAEFLRRVPEVTLRMLRTECRRLRANLTWRA
jgi:trk system potassium uptake protein TrkA